MQIWVWYLLGILLQPIAAPFEKASVTLFVLPSIGKSAWSGLLSWALQLLKQGSLSAHVSLKWSNHGALGLLFALILFCLSRAVCQIRMILVLTAGLTPVWVKVWPKIKLNRPSEAVPCMLIIFSFNLQKMTDGSVFSNYTAESNPSLMEVKTCPSGGRFSE